jgi:hypothetical protein
MDLLQVHKERLEKILWNRNQELFAPEIDLVLMDTTNTYFTGPTIGTLAQFGKSKEKRYDRRLVSIGPSAQFALLRWTLTGDGPPSGMSPSARDLREGSLLLKVRNQRSTAP